MVSLGGVKRHPPTASTVAVLDYVCLSNVEHRDSLRSGIAFRTTDQATLFMFLESLEYDLGECSQTRTILG